MLTLTFRGSAAWWYGEYLKRLGGRGLDALHYQGGGWSAALRETEVTAFGLRFPEVTVQLEGEPEVVADLAARLRQMGMRGGG